MQSHIVVLQKCIEMMNTLYLLGGVFEVYHDRGCLGVQIKIRRALMPSSTAHYASEEAVADLIPEAPDEQTTRPF